MRTTIVCSTVIALCALPDCGGRTPAGGSQTGGIAGSTGSGGQATMKWQWGQEQILPFRLTRVRDEGF